MSTRATIKVVKNNEVKYRIYHHCDGYPEGVGSELHYIFSSKEMFDPDKLWENRENGLNGDISYEFEDTVDMHGDEEYEYTIDCDNKKILCYDLYEDTEILL